MKSLTVIDNDDLRTELTEHLTPLGFDFIHYANPLKAMENLEEIAPDVVFFNAQDFPRHWKPFIVVMQALFPHESPLFFLLTDESSFNFDEAAKASHLQVNGIINNLDEQADEIENLFDSLGRKNLLFEQRLTRRYTPRAFDQTGFMFTHPRSLKLITGQILDLSPGGLAFLPDHPHLTADLLFEEKIPYATLNLEQEVLSLEVAVVRNNETLALRFEESAGTDRETIVRFIQNSIQRALKSQIETTKVS